jgi:glycosyltransferase involved in cell wall biosynthesis
MIDRSQFTPSVHTSPNAFKVGLCITVIIPTFNQAGTLSRAVNSVAVQTRRPREVIVVDDASTDDTPAVMAELARQHPPGWIKCVTLKNNSGPATARNSGWDAATTPLVAFLDADDTWHPRKLELQGQWMEAHPEIAFCGHRLQGDHGSTWTKGPTEREAHVVSVRRLLFSNPFVTTSTVMLRRDLRRRFQPGKRHCEDYLLWLELTFSGHPGAMLPLTLARAHKPLYGASGLSGDLRAMHRGEQDNYGRLYVDGRINRAWWALASAWSLLRHVRRLALTKARWPGGGGGQSA